jgi:hypothetical protein
MPKFRVKELSLIGNELHQPGAEVELPEGTLPAENLEPLCDEGRALQKQYQETNAARVKQMMAANPESGVGDPAAFAKALAEHQQSQAEAIGTAVANGIAAAFARFFPNGLPAAPVEGAVVAAPPALPSNGGKGGKGASLV